MTAPFDLDPMAVRRQFGRRAGRIGQADFLLREVEGRMLERLDLLTMRPSVLLDVGCGTGHGLAALAQRYPDAHPIGIDVAPAMLAQALATRRRTRTMLARVRRLVGAAPRVGLESLCAADAAALPLARDSVDMIWSNLAWHWFADPAAVATEWQRVLRPNGVLMFSTFGVDTLVELRALGASLPPFPDLHDIGDLLGSVGFSEPVVDCERLTVTWSDPARLLADLRSVAGHAHRGRPRGLASRARRASWLEALASRRDAAGNIALTFELVYAQAWCPPTKRRSDGLATVRVRARADSDSKK
jgi:malonyl-CoA O-methyltransferase